MIYLQLHVYLVNKDQGIDLIQLEASNSLTNLKSSKIALKHLAESVHHEKVIRGNNTAFMKTQCHTSITMTSVRTKVGYETCTENVHHQHLTKTIRPS